MLTASGEFIIHPVNNTNNKTQCKSVTGINDYATQSPDSVVKVSKFMSPIDAKPTIGHLAATALHRAGFVKFLSYFFFCILSSTKLKLIDITLSFFAIFLSF